MKINRITSRVFLFILFAASLGLSFGIKGKASDIEKSEYVSDSIEAIQDSLAFELAQIYGLDQGVRTSKGFKNKMRLIQCVDSLNFYRIFEFVKTHGMPSDKLLGKNNYKRECVQSAFFAVMLHNPHMLVNNEEYLNFFADLVKKGELREGILLTILDKYYWAKNSRRVLYGSQFGMPHIDDKEKTNKARVEIGVKPLPDSLFIRH